MIAGVDFPDIAVLPPYTFTEDGIHYLAWSLKWNQQILGIGREIMPPDKVKVINEEDSEDGPRSLLGRSSGKWFKRPFNGATTTIRRSSMTNG